MRMHSICAYVQTAQRQLKEARDGAVEREQHYGKELATAQRVSDLLRTQAEDRAARAAELEGIVRELKDHLQVRLHAV